MIMKVGTNEFYPLQAKSTATSPGRPRLDGNAALEVPETKPGSMFNSKAFEVCYAPAATPTNFWEMSVTICWVPVTIC